MYLLLFGISGIISYIYSMLDTDIRKVLERGVVRVYPDAEKLEAALRVDPSKLTFYYGIDPTAPFIHLGHTIGIRKLEQLRKLGCKVIVLMGNFTATIGDPTDKMAARTALTLDMVEENAKNYLEFMKPVLGFDDMVNPVEVRRNNEWWGDMPLREFMGLASKVTVQQLLERDMFQQRIAEGKPIYLHEFMYPLLQGYDSVAMNATGEVGGNDQTFNMLMGRGLVAEFNGQEKFVISLKLLADNQGKKMGKSEGNAVPLDATPQDMFGKIMSWSDDVMESAFELLTDVEETEYKALISSSNPRETKARLAREIVSVFHGAEAAQQASEEFDKVFRDKAAPEDMPVMAFASSLTPVEVLVEAGLATSKSDARRVIEQGGFSLDSEVITNTEQQLELKSGSVIKKGKHGFVKVK
jgi:tyrosyl-tRNA synthetase